MTEGISISNAVVMVVCTMFGCGVLFLPKSFLILYWPYALALFIFLGCFTMTTLYFLCMAAHTLSDKKIDYSTICNKIHPFVGHYINVAVLLSGMISCTLYSKCVFEFISSYVDKSYHMLLKLCLFGIFSIGAYLKDLKRLEKLGYLAITSVMLLAGIILFYMISVGCANVYSDGANNLGGSLSNMIFAFACHQSVVTIYSNLSVPSTRNIKILCVASVIGCSLVYGFIALGGAFLLGSEMSGENNIIEAMNSKIFAQRLKESIDKNGFLVKMAILSFSLMIFSSFSFQFHPARSSLMNIISGIVKSDVSRSNLRRNVITTALLAIILILFLSDPQMQRLIAYANAFGTVGFTVILPCLVYFKTQKKMSFSKIFSLIMSLAGLPLVVFFLVGGK
ncbi:Amino acid transporter AVT6A [Dictyocoela muelleri]|nr:Amino acid transporter AVT6A [Dictyocoela muelleri]